MIQKINLVEAFGAIGKPYTPKLGGLVNDSAIKLAKFDGPFIWHSHEAEDECFLVVKGAIDLEFRDQTVTVNEGEYCIVPRGVEHRPVAREEAWVLMFEPNTTLNTGNVTNERTVMDLESI